MIQVIIAGFVLGLISSFHCVGMCGPLALSLPIHHLDRPQQVIAISLYNIGRVITYSLIGLLFGIMGRTIYLAGFQQWFSILLGILMLLLTIQYFFAGNALHPKWLNGLHAGVQQMMMRVLQSKNRGAYMLLGMANGLLPCGMVYLAIAGALSTTELANSVLFMAFFGFGTLPAMFILGFLGMKVNLITRQYLRKLVPYVAAIMAVILILRGLNLGIPFISPVLADRPHAAIVCP
jgi:sulfite exporter TauE/SafE